MELQKFSGIFPALLTPFDKDDNVNISALNELIDMNIGKGVNGFYVNGSTAEAFLLDDDERKLIYKAAADRASGKVTLIAHVGAISTKKAIEFARYAKDCGYDAISAVAPFYFKFGFEQIKKHYFDIVDAVDMPMIIYNFPNFSGVNLTVGQVSQFLCDERFIGVKHTSNDYFALSSFKSAFPDRVIYNGFDEMFLSGLAMGADGGIGSTYNFMAEKFIKMKELFRAGKHEEALEIQRVANSIITSLCKVGVMEGEKEVLCQLGIDFGKCRAPFAELTAEQKKIIADEIIPLL